MSTPPLHFLPSLAHPYPLCGVTDAALVTMQPLQVTCKKCQAAFKAASVSQDARSVRQVSGQGGLSERRLLDAVRQQAEACSFLCYHTHDSRRSEAGFPDLVLAKPGRPVIFAELKTARGKLTRAQAQWITTLAQVEGVIAAVWRPADLLAIQAFLATQRDGVQERQDSEEHDADPQRTARLDCRDNGENQGGKG